MQITVTLIKVLYEVGTPGTKWYKNINICQVTVSNKVNLIRYFLYLFRQ